MVYNKKRKGITDYGDFQTPIGLAREVCLLLRTLNLKPRSIVEPTCGKGTFLVASLNEFRSVEKIIGFDINPLYVAEANECLKRYGFINDAVAVNADFFKTDWPAIFDVLPEPILVVGNPPWVTNAELSKLRSSNLPEKKNIRRFTGLDAITGKSNFDISEWMLIQTFDSVRDRKATVAMLCKTSVARKVLKYLWENDYTVAESRIYLIDAAKHFGISVDACLLVSRLTPNGNSYKCTVYKSMNNPEIVTTIGFRDKIVVANVHSYERWKHLRGDFKHIWRSGIKHDCAKVMELTKVGVHYCNGLGEEIYLEEDYLYPMLKGSDIAKGRIENPEKWMLVTQKTVGDDTSVIKYKAPRTWEYLQAHAEYLDRRASSIYKKRPRFSVFGVGMYSWSPWKVAISGFYKKIDFKVIGVFTGKPIVLDDTSYFLPCYSEAEAHQIASILNSQVVKEFLESFIFWDDKRPIKSELLNRLHLVAAANEIGVNTALIGRLLKLAREHSLFALS